MEQSGGGGGWQGGRGPWSQGPWGQGPSGPPGRGGNQPPDLEELIRKSQERLRQILPGGGGSTGSLGRGQWLAVIVLVLLGWLLYERQHHQAGRERTPSSVWEATTAPSAPACILSFAGGAHREASGGGGESDRFRRRRQGRGPDACRRPEHRRHALHRSVEDQGPARDFLFIAVEQQERSPGVRERHARGCRPHPAEEIRTRGRQAAQDQVRDLIQRTLDGYRSGVLITGVQLEKADPPPQVVDAFEEVQRAEQNQNKLIREAEQYRNQIPGQARGDAASSSPMPRPTNRVSWPRRRGEAALPVGLRRI